MSRRSSHTGAAGQRDGQPSLDMWGIRLADEEGSAATDLAIAAGAALAGGQAACRYYGSAELGIHDKLSNGLAVAVDGEAENPVTLADHAANEAILAFLRARSGEPVLSEEAEPPSDLSARERLWVVDPLDGTKEFIARNGEFSVMVGLAEGGSALLGAVYQPAVGRLYLGHMRDGAWCVEDPEGAGTSAPLRISGRAARPIRLIRSRSHPDPALQELESRLSPVEIVISGSVGIKCARVASGAADLYVHPVPYLKEWDTCAPEAVLRGAGGLVTDCSGEPLRYGKPDSVQPLGIFCGRPDVHQRVAPVVREVVGHLSTG